MTVPRIPVGVRVALIGAIGTTFFIVGVTLFFTWRSLIISLIHKQLRVVPGSETYRIWRDTPVPQYMNFYFFNWTNFDRLETQKPIFQEIGPYRFSVLEKKTNITHNSNGTITFRIMRYWHFDEANSVGPLEEEVYTLNTVAKTAAHSVRHWSTLMRRSLSVTMGAFGTKVYVKKPVGELLFDGYSDPLLETASKLPAFSGLEVPFDKFGWFYMVSIFRVLQGKTRILRTRNGSTEFDGLFNMDTGENGVEEFGILRRWNYYNSTGFYDGNCGLVNGSAGELFPPNVKISKGVEMFSPDLCRSIKLNYVEDVKLHGLKGLKFAGDETTFDNGTLDESNSCFCSGDCSPTGVLNVTNCRFGAPGFVSFPHFHLADPIYREEVDGMKPDPMKHTLYITLEPELGIPLDVAARFQINILLSPDDTIKLFRNVPTIYFPMIWFEQRASITPEMASELRLALAIPTWNGYIAIGGLLVGSALVAWAVYTFTTKYQR
ncbi:unnamed protein product [Nesidiocoris tenuis]|uniref:Uncharacterized protein n=1 Tax=Nesidiocoris tenuis TaxID=355587 RepID=A0A6H5HQ13_9HEMI|nr:unnamed protein product [Nesidiocoris tenuis]